ncbi:DNA-binding response regulator [Paractinoplanes atraurantiacus]|uniref:DNA-binding response regulator, NarL/FixJ family, contains REC and HTH domains n=1 Tax=Paractinoplanes atraurantiacus TaxID=1036182 RepID=A0A285HQF5_9ACTN|nr:DNA-binding response regulator [Actinoplanes atraurantiacus]SNY36941.1 DNA-binding response regulator, NarL/FixJ family, contains REC and HTH domains [Actinoplanes atraurantiacus]
MLAAAGHHTETPADVVEWAARPTSDLVLLTIAGAPQWRVLARMREARSKPPVVAVMDAASPREGLRAVRAGARSVVSRDAAPASLRLAVEATISGQSVLPAAVAGLLAAGPAADPETVPPDRIGWLSQLAAGATVARLATEAGYSERAMFRLLTRLYREMGVNNRIEAIMRARDRGWI